MNVDYEAHIKVTMKLFIAFFVSSLLGKCRLPRHHHH